MDNNEVQKRVKKAIAKVLKTKVKLVSNAKDVELVGDAEISLNAGELKIVPPEKYSVEKAGLSATQGPFNLSLGQTGTTASFAMRVQVSVIFFISIKAITCMSLLSANICFPLPFFLHRFLTARPIHTFFLSKI